MIIIYQLDCLVQCDTVVQWLANWPTSHAVWGSSLGGSGNSLFVSAPVNTSVKWVHWALGEKKGGKGKVAYSPHSGNIIKTEGASPSVAFRSIKLWNNLELTYSSDCLMIFTAILHSCVRLNLYLCPFVQWFFCKYSNTQTVAYTLLLAVISSNCWYTGKWCKAINISILFTDLVDFVAAIDMLVYF